MPQITKLKIILKSVFSLAIFALALQAGAAWELPSSGTAPANNIPPPVNVGGDPQMKSGTFGALGIRAVLNTTTGAGGIGIFDTKVGVGTLAPTQPLDVVGNVKFSGALMPNGAAGALNQVLTSTGVGVAPVWSLPSTVITNGGGMLNPMTTTGDMIYGSTTATPSVPARLGIGSAGQVLTVNSSGLPVWQTASGGAGGPWTRTGTNTHLINSGDKVGIGTETPAQQLQITGNFTMPDTGSGSNGIIYKGANTFLHNKGDSSTFLGLSAGNFPTASGSANTGLGWVVLDNLTSGNNNTAVGTSALYSNNTGSYNTALGWAASYENEGGQNNTALGRGALEENINGNQNTAVGSQADVPGGSSLNNITLLGYGATVSTSNKVRIGNAAVTAYETQVPWTTGSDARFKKNIKDLDLGLDFINSLRPVSYQMKNDTDDRQSFGFIAQEVEKVLGENKAKLVDTQVDGEQMKYMRYDDLIAPMVKAIQEQQERIEELEAKIETLQSE